MDNLGYRINQKLKYPEYALNSKTNNERDMMFLILKTSYKYIMNIREEQDYKTSEINILTNEQFFEYVVHKYKWAEDYVFYYMYEIYYNRDSILNVLETIDECDKNRFTKPSAYEYIKKYEKKRLGIGIIIPTCNRPEAIEYLLNVAALLLRRQGVDIIIYDSSEEDDTKNIVNKFIKNGFYNVIYSKYMGKYDGFSLDHKLIAAYEQYVDCYEYVWICRDGLIPVIDEFIEMLRFYAKKNIDCFIVDTKARVNNLDIVKQYSSIDDCEDLLLEQASRLQTLGMLIFSKRLIRSLIEKEPLREENYSLWQMAAPLHLFAKTPFIIIFITRNVFAPNIKASSTHFWSKGENAIQQWGYRWCNVLDSLPKEYNNVKDRVKMIYTVDFHPFTIGTVLRMRAWGDLKFKTIKKNACYLKQVTKTPIWILYFASITPKFIIRIISFLLTLIGHNNRIKIKKILNMDYSNN